MPTSGRLSFVFLFMAAACYISLCASARVTQSSRPLFIGGLGFTSTQHGVSGGARTSHAVRYASTINKVVDDEAEARKAVQQVMKSLPPMDLSKLPEPAPLTSTTPASSTDADGYDHTAVKLSPEGLPLTYDPATIQKFWDARPGEMQRRWALFISVTAPFLTSLFRSFTAGSMLSDERKLARDLRIVLEKLGPTFVKLGQALSIRPDVVGPAATEELAKLQDAVPRFSNDVAFSILNEELGRPWQEVFSELSPEPIAAASLAQVYKGRLASNGEYVAVKVQRPEMLATVSKDLYVMRRAVEVYQKYIVERFTAQKTDYQELLQVWAQGFYEELDFLNEGANQIRMKEALQSSEGIYVPTVYKELSTRKLLVTEWIDGIKLSQAPKDEIRRLTKVAQECFLRQLLELGSFHADPHPGNLLVLSDKSKGELAILDFGLMAQLRKEDMETMVNALVHTANKDFGRLIDDLVDLQVLPADTDRAQVEPVMRRVIGPYVFQGGGAKAIEFRSLAKDLTQATVEIPFSIPSYFALVARALGVLEGIALTGDPDYRIVMEAYPFVSRRLMTDDSPRLQRALNDILYGNGKGEQLSFRRLSALIAYAMNVKDGADAKNVETLFVDFDQLPTSTAVRLNETVAFLLSQKAAPIRSLLVDEAASASDLLIRQQFRRASLSLHSQLRIPVPPFFPRPPPPPYPQELVDSLAPPLSVEEEVYAGSLVDLAYSLAGIDPTRTDMTPQQVLAWLQGVDVQEALNVATLLDPRSPTGANLFDFGERVVGQLADKARPRLERVLGTQLPVIPTAGATSTSTSSSSAASSVGQAAMNGGRKA